MLNMYNFKDLIFKTLINKVFNNLLFKPIIKQLDYK